MKFLYIVPLKNRYLSENWFIAKQGNSGCQIVFVLLVRYIIMFFAIIICDSECFMLVQNIQHKLIILVSKLYISKIN